MLFAYYVDNSIHQIPSFIYIAKVLGGTVLTDGPDAIKILRQDFPDVAAEFYATRAELQQRLAGAARSNYSNSYSKTFLNVI